jgi:HSP20 family protein
LATKVLEDAMSNLNRIPEAVRDTLDVVAEGWQEMWSKARNAITRFTPTADGKNLPAPRGNRWGMLSAELHESADHLELEIEAPGMDKGDFEIFVSGNSLVVRGKKAATSERNEGQYHITERAYGRFERVFQLPVEVTEEGTLAKYKHGVLKIQLPKSVSAKPRVISIS